MTTTTREKLGRSTVLDPPCVCLLDPVPQPSWAMLADRVGRTPATHIDGGPDSGG
ncbi:MAG: hypothetical protein ACRDTD_10955 [Pseudonocardiaceae bacterium]